MALNIHTDSQLEKCLTWLAKHLQKTKTDLIKEMVYEKYRLKRAGFQFGALRGPKKSSPRRTQKALKQLDRDRDLD